jgi:hypothetical protein
MKMMKMVATLSIGVALSACGAADVVTRAAPLTGQTTSGTVNFMADPAQPSSVRTISAGEQQSQTILPEAILQQINVAQINVSVPTKLRVSEANRYYPYGDIVWREDPMGNRHAQVARIMYDAMTAGTASFTGPVPVILDIEVVRFHALSEKARYTIGGVHHVVFNMVLRDGNTGQPLSEPRRVATDLDAFGGQQALNAEARGLTQKVRISGHLGEVIRQELSRPEGYTNASLGFYQLVNRL